MDCFVSGIGLVLFSRERFPSILYPKNNTVWLVNKEENQHNKALFTISSIEDLKFFHLYLSETTKPFSDALLGEHANDDCCLIANDKVVYKIVNDSATIIYSSDFKITDITEIHSDAGIFGVCFLTDTKTAIVAYPHKHALNFEKVELLSNPYAFCAGLCKNFDDYLWIIYSDESHSRHLFKKLDSPDLEVVSETEYTFRCVRLKNETLVCLSNSTEEEWLVKVDLDEVRNRKPPEGESEEFAPVPSADQEINDIIQKIEAKTAELEEVNAEYLEQQDLKMRINMFNLKRRIFCVPKISVVSMSGLTFVIADFQKSLPRNIQTILTLKLGGKSLFCIKNVDSNGVVKLMVPNHMITTQAEIRIDSIVVRTEKGPWCLIHNFVQDPPASRENKGRLDAKQKDFIANKIAVLKKLMREGNVDMGTLREMHASVRKELRDVFSK